MKGIPTCKVQYVRQLLYNYITKSISLNDAIQDCKKNLGRSDPIDRLAYIMNVPEVAPPASQFILDRINCKKTKIWTQLEDHRLLAAIRRYGLNDWTNVSRFVGNGRNRCQCSQRWQRSLNPLINKNSWLPAEDQTLLSAVRELGVHSWMKVSALLPGRTDVQCRYRYQLITKKMTNPYLNVNQYMKNSESTNENDKKIENGSKIEVENSTNIKNEAISNKLCYIIDNVSLENMLDEIASDPNSIFKNH